jgi:hypothetical protein
MSRIIKGDESYISGYDTETKQQSSQWKSPQTPRAKKAWQVWSSTRSNAHCFFLFFFDVKGIVHREFALPNTKLNSDFYCDVLRCLRENVR